MRSIRRGRPAVRDHPRTGCVSNGAYLEAWREAADQRHVRALHQGAARWVGRYPALPLQHGSSPDLSGLGRHQQSPPAPHRVGRLFPHAGPCHQGSWESHFPKHAIFDTVTRQIGLNGGRIRIKLPNPEDAQRRGRSSGTWRFASRALFPTAWRSRLSLLSHSATTIQPSPQQGLQYHCMPPRREDL